MKRIALNDSGKNRLVRNNNEKNAVQVMKNSFAKKSFLKDGSYN